MMETTVINLFKGNDIYIGRAGRGNDGYFGNPIKLSEGDLPGVDPEVFYLIFEKDYLTNVDKFGRDLYPRYICGIDPCKSEPKSFWHKIRKFFGLKYKRKFSSSVGVACKVFKDGKIEVIL